MACLSGLSAIIDGGCATISRSSSRVSNDRENLGRVFVFAAILTVVIFVMPAPSTEANAKILVATATGVAVGCILIISHALISSSIATVRDIERAASSDSKDVSKVPKEDSKDVSKVPKEDLQDSASASAPLMSPTSSTSSTSSTSPRPSFAKPTRESRARQLQSQVKEFCTLSFDEVEAPEQSGLTCRMLALMNMLSTGVTYWRGDEKVEEEVFRILDLSDVDMRAIRCAVNAAAALVDSHKWRDAYDLLCTLRNWFVASDVAALELQRKELREGILALGLAPDAKAKGSPKVSVGKTEDKFAFLRGDSEPASRSRCASTPNGGSSRGRHSRKKA